MSQNQQKKDDDVNKQTEEMNKKEENEIRSDDAKVEEAREEFENIAL